MLGFVGFVLLVVVGIHLYLWKRLIRDTTRPGPWRRLGGIVMIVLALLIPATLIGVRGGYVEFLAWPGYLWLALMFYLLVILVALEIPRLIIGLVWRARSRSAGGRAPELVGAGATTTPGTSGTAAGAGTTTRGAGPTTAVAEPTGSGASSAVPGAAPPASNTPASDTAPAPSGTAPAASDAALARSGTAPAASGTTPTTAGTTPTTAGATPAGEGASPAASDPKRGTHARLAAGTATADELSSNTQPGIDQAADRTTDERSTDERSADDGSADERPGIERRLLLARGAAIFAGLTAAGITGYGVKTALGGPRLDRVQIPIAKLPRAMDGTRIAVVSDIHLGPLTGANHMSRIVSMINSVDADVVCVVGDLVDGTVEELGRFATPMRDIRSRQGAYFVTGNHEYYSGFQQWVDEVARLGVRPLRNERLEIRTRGGVFDLAGVNDPGGAEFNDAPDFERALGDRDTARPVVLMAHQPVVARDVARYGVDLQLSGHTHGGQMVPFNLLVKLQQPVVSGYGEVDGVPVYVTNGAGFWGPPVRVGVPPQVTLVELRTP